MPFTGQLEPRNEFNRDMFGSRLSRDVVTGKHVHGNGCSLECKALREYYTMFAFSCDDCPTCFRDLDRLIFCEHSPAAQAYEQGRRTREIDEFFLMGGQLPCQYSGKYGCIGPGCCYRRQWDLSRAPEACLSVTREAQQELRLEMAARRDRWAAAHDLPIYNTPINKSEVFFRDLDNRSDMQWVDKDVCWLRGQPIPDSVP